MSVQTYGFSCPFCGKLMELELDRHIEYIGIVKPIDDIVPKNRGDLNELWGRTDWTADNNSIPLKEGWFCDEFEVNYDKGEVRIKISRSDKK